MAPPYGLKRNVIWAIQGVFITIASGSSDGGEGVDDGSGGRVVGIMVICSEGGGGRFGDYSKIPPK